MKTLSLLIAIPLLFGSFLYAQEVDNGFAILPELSGSQIDDASGHIADIGKEPGKVMDTYQQKAEELSGDLAMQMATGIMNRNTLLNYVVYLIRFLSQIGLVIGALMVIYAGYLYATSVFGGKINEGNAAIKYAVIGVLVIVFAYAIMKGLTALFLGT